MWSNDITRSLPFVAPLKPGEEAQRGTALYILSVVMLLFAAVFVAARISARLSSSAANQGLGKDDFCVVAALIASVGLSLTEIQATVYGGALTPFRFFNPIMNFQWRYNVPNGSIPLQMKPNQVMDYLILENICWPSVWFYSAQIIYKVVITLNKLALLTFYLRIFPHPRFRLLCYGGVALVGLWGIAYIVVTIFQCTPVAFYWNRAIAGGHCIKSEPFWISYATTNIVTDFYILCLPMPLLYRLTLSNKSKWGIIGCFAIGGFVCFTTIIRMTTLASSASGKDLTYGPVPATNWSVIEANTGIICTCLPMLKQYLAMILRCFGRKASSSSSGNSPRTRRENDPHSSTWTRDESSSTGHPWRSVDSKAESERPKSKLITES